MTEQVTRKVDDLVYGLIKPRCLEVLMHVDLMEFAQGDCLKETTSKLLGFAIILLAPLSKLPQIIKVIMAGSVEGLSTIGFLVETFGYLVFFVYNYCNDYPFSSYGEVLFIYIQNMIIILLIAVYRSLSVFQGLFFVALGAGILIMTPDGFVPLSVLAMLQSMQVVIATSSKLPQIFENLKNGSTGQLSGITVFLFFAGSLARVFTTLQEAPDPILIASVGVSFFFNTVLFIQVLIYSGSKKKIKKICGKNREKLE